MKESKESNRSNTVSESRFTDLARICSDGVADCRDGMVIAANPALCALLQSPPDDLIGQQFGDLIRPDLRDQTTRKLREACAAENDHLNAIPASLIRSDGAAIGVHLEVTGIDSEATVEWLICVRPAVGYEQSGSLDRDQLTQLAHVHRMSVFGELTASLLHDFSQPLTAAKGAAETVALQLQKESEHAILARSAQIASDATAAAAEQLQRMWDFVRPSESSQQVELSELLASAFQLVQPAAKHGGILLDLNTDRPATVRGERSVLMVAIVNLLSRSLAAVRGMTNGVPRISARTNQRPRRAELLISHNGDLLRSEQEFLSLPAESMIADHPLALPVVRSIIDRSGGVLSVGTEADGDGVEYRAVFPLQ